MRVRLLRLSSIVCVCLVTMTARAQDEPTSFAWERREGAETCIESAALTARVSARLGGYVFADDLTATRRVRGHIALEGRGFTVTVEVRGVNGVLLGRRTLVGEGADCHAIEDALVLLLALLVDPARALAPDTPPPDPEPEPEPEPVVQEAPPHEDEVPVQRSPSRRLGVALFASGDVTAGILPSVAWGGGLGAELVLDARARVVVALSAHVFAPETVRRAEGEVRFFAGRFDLQGGARMTRGAFVLDGLAGMALGPLAARGRGFAADNASYIRVAGGPLLTVRVGLTRGRLLVRLRASVEFALFRDRFYVEAEDGSRETWHRPGPVYPDVGLELGAALR